jgi:hypothetical protein
MYTVSKQLQKTFIGRGEVKGMVFTCCAKSHLAYMYKVSGNSEYYEVFFRKIDTRFGHECYPRSKSFGQWAWAFTNYEKAINKFNMISQLNTQNA